ncbi:hypothetical protein GOP56_18690 [Brevibacillus sp. 7WMA2]|uniref:DUF4363 family protein n=4 Tax=Brevibacillus TaxID=55080 RepID=A0A075R141_BRELA|nr:MULTISPECIES: hypothetical protein [Brevibacillus]HAS02055.1 hypothetical protein [Brevibacillus sp.]AIG24913.1 hypothetical protein BRLA_c005550 [Brevibacillus laterosporus LMG 15441]AKF94830.1 hypothetical protein EX87_05965 [Brevibacillus laterosporus]ERM16638.1 hypothetical protein P615_22580 [Brevibacillus laterosporus PE36]MCR8963949.1 hypothetical protein [Brevibacillus laterosporus]
MKRNKMILFTILVVLVISNVYFYTKNYTEITKIESSIDTNFRSNLADIAKSLKRDSDWNTRYILAISFSSKLQSLVEYTSYSKKSSLVGSYSYILVNFFLNQQKLGIQLNTEDNKTLIACLEVLSENPTDKEKIDQLLRVITK